MASNNNSNMNLRSVLEKDKLSGTNFLDWSRNLRIVLKQERKLYVLEKPLPPEPAANAPRAEQNAHKKHLDDIVDVTCLMLATMNSELQKQFEEMEAYEIIGQLKEMFQEQARLERYATTKAFNSCKMAAGSSVSAHILKMKSYLDHLEKLGSPISQELAIDTILQSLPDSYDQFIMNYNMHHMEKTIPELHGMLKTAEQNIKTTSSVLMVKKGKGMKRKGNFKGKGKGKSKESQNVPKPKSKTKPPKEGVCFFCNEPGHWKRNCKLYLEEVKKRKSSETTTSGIYVIEVNLSTSTSWVFDTGCGSHICANVQGLKRRRSLTKGEVDLRVGNGAKVAALAVGTYELALPSGLILSLNNCYYVPAMSRNIISVACLDLDGFDFIIKNNNCSIFKRGLYYGNAYLANGLYILNIEQTNQESIYNINTKRFKSNDLNETYFWHCRLGHINEKRITKLHQDGLLHSFDLESFETCESCLLGKMTKKPFTKQCERSNDLLALIHSDVCGPLSIPARGGYQYFITFTDDYSRYGYVYLLKHKSESFEKFKIFKNEVQNQLGKNIKALRSDRGGEYLSQEFENHLKECGIVSQLTPPGTPQWNGVSERRNRTLLDMVRCMMSQTNLPTSFWGYALETAAFILNRTPSKSVQKTPYEIWTGKRPSLSFLKIWGCEAYVKRQVSDKLTPKSNKCIFVGYPKETKGYYFYIPSDNKVFVARNGIFLEREFISKRTSGSKVTLEEVQEPQITNEPSMEIQSDLQTVVESVPVTQEPRRSDRIRQEPERYGFLISDDHDMIMNQNEPTSYQEAVDSPDSEKWIEAMKTEMQSMYENQVWDLVDPPEGLKTIGCKWVFKRKTDMDGKVHTFKARLVAKGFRQTHGVDYDETFSPVVMLKSIRILLAIAAYYDYEIWQMDVKTVFLNGHLLEDVYMAQPEGFVDPTNSKRVCKLHKSIYGLKQASRSWNLRFDNAIKEFGFIKNEDEPCVYKKISGSVTIFLILYVDDILLIGNDIPTLQNVKTWLGKCFSMKDLGEAAYILGIKIYRDRSKRLIGLSQSAYIDKVLKRFSMQDSKRGFLPISHGMKLGKAQCPTSKDE